MAMSEKCLCLAGRVEDHGYGTVNLMPATQFVRLYFSVAASSFGSKTGVPRYRLCSQHSGDRGDGDREAVKLSRRCLRNRLEGASYAALSNRGSTQLVCGPGRERCRTMYMARCDAIFEIGVDFIKRTGHWLLLLSALTKTPRNSAA